MAMPVLAHMYNEVVAFLHQTDSASAMTDSHHISNATGPAGSCQQASAFNAQLQGLLGFLKAALSTPAADIAP
jgi:hypothetical protein